MILITGGTGQLGTELKKYLDELNVSYDAPSSKVLDITDSLSVKKYVQETSPAVIFHCAAYTAVDKAEDSGVSENIRVNILGTLNISEAAERVGATLFYVSTDYVFDGNAKDGEYLESDTKNPINEYGRAKLYGENIVEKIVSHYYIVRTSWVYGEFGNNFVKTMINLAHNKDELTIVSDQIGRPTWTRTIVEFMYHLSKKKPDYGVYQISNDGKCSWYEFALEILKEFDNLKIKPIDSNEFLQTALRPKYSVMSIEKAKCTGFEPIHWKSALKSMRAGNFK